MALPVQVIVPAMTPGAALLALHRVLTQLQEHIPACATVVLVLGEGTHPPGNHLQSDPS